MKARLYRDLGFVSRESIRGANSATWVLRTRNDAIVQKFRVEIFRPFVLCELQRLLVFESV
jgi:hypothetical protein